MVRKEQSCEKQLHTFNVRHLQGSCALCTLHSHTKRVKTYSMTAALASPMNIRVSQRYNTAWNQQGLNTILFQVCRGLQCKSNHFDSAMALHWHWNSKGIFVRSDCGCLVWEVLICIRNLIIFPIKPFHLHLHIFKY